MPADAKADAKQLLEAHGLTVDEVLLVEPHSILFRGDGRTIRTAWLAMRNGRVVRIVADSGYPRRAVGLGGAPARRGARA